MVCMRALFEVLFAIPHPDTVMSSSSCLACFLSSEAKEIELVPFRMVMEPRRNACCTFTSSQDAVLSSESSSLGSAVDRVVRLRLLLGDCEAADPDTLLGLLRRMYLVASCIEQEG